MGRSEKQPIFINNNNQRTPKVLGAFLIISQIPHARYGGTFASKAETNQIRTRSEGEANQNV